MGFLLVQQNNRVNVSQPQRTCYYQWLFYLLFLLNVSKFFPGGKSQTFSVFLGQSKKSVLFMHFPNIPTVCQDRTATLGDWNRQWSRFEKQEERCSWSSHFILPYFSNGCPQSLYYCFTARLWRLLKWKYLGVQFFGK